MFTVLLSDLPQYISERHDLVDCALYADDLAIWSKSRRYLQAALQTIEHYSEMNSMIVNVAKTKWMKFGRGGPPASGDVFRMGGEVIEKVRHFAYLGIDIAARGVCFAGHVKQRVSKARAAFVSIPTPRELSLDTALALFRIKIEPIASYGIELIWIHLRGPQLEALDRLKASYLKSVLGVHRTSRNRLVYKICGSNLLSVELQQRFGLPLTEAFRAHSEHWNEKFGDIDGKLYETPAMKNDEWRGPRFKLRHRFTRGAMHGFHFLICDRRAFHLADEACRCSLCGESCDTYHLYHCTQGHLFDWKQTG